MSKPFKPSALDIGLQALREESAGILDIHIIDPNVAMELIEDALGGCPEAAMLMTALIDAIAVIDAAPDKRTMLCGCCPRPLRGTGYRIGLALPRKDAPQKAVAFGICFECANDGEPIEVKAVECLKKIWPDGRLIQFSGHEAGHA